MLKRLIRCTSLLLFLTLWNETPVRAALPPFITLSFPNLGTDTCYSGTIQYISWDSDVTIQYVTIVLTVDSGITWDTLASNLYNLGFYEWMVPSVITNRARVRVLDASFTPASTSAQWFPIRPPNPLILLSAPNGGEQLASGTTFPIQWSHAYLDSVTIEYSIDSAQSWLPVVSGFPANMGQYNWVVPNTPSDDVFVRVKDFNSNVSDRSNATLSIFTAVPDVYLFSPIGGELWAQGSVQNIQWTSSYMQDVSIELSTNGGNTWSFITPSTPASDGIFIWTVPSTLSTNCFIRISDLASSATSTHAIPFSIIPPALQIFTPNGAESVSAGWPMVITWNGYFVSNLVNVEYTIDNGVNWLPLANAVLNQNSFLWYLPYTPSTQCKVRVSDALYPAVVDESDAVFEITPPVPLIELISPQTSVNWNLYSVQPIEYTAINVQSLKLELSVDSGQSYSTVATGILPSAGVFNWQVQGTPSNECLLRLTDENVPTAFDGSDSLFTISALPPQIVLWQPFGTETYAQGSTQTIDWTYQTVQFIKVELSLDNGLTWQTLAASIPSSQLSYQWTVPFIASTQAIIKLSDVNNPLVFDASGNFTVTPSSISLINPNGGETIVGLSDFTINWNPGGVNTPVALEYTLNNGQSWNTIVSSIPNNGQYTWTAPAGGSLQCKVRIKSVLNPSVNDVSDLPFVITLPQPQVRVIYPNGGEYFGAGTQVPVQFVSYQVNYVRVEYRMVGTTAWALASPLVTASQGLFYWQIPATITSGQFEIRILDASDFALNDISDGGFTIGTGSLQLTNPNGGFLSAGNPYTITWNSTGGSPYTDLLFSQDNGLTYQSITANPVSNIGSFVWNVPYLQGNAFRVKVRDHFVPTVQDSSDQAFQLIGLTNQLILNYPMGAELFAAGESIVVQWNPSAVATIRIEFSQSGGTAWTPLATGVPGNAGSHLVTLPSVTTTQGRIRIVDEANLLNYTFSQQNFSVTTPFVQLHPITSVYSNSQVYLTWNSAGVDFVDLYYKHPGGSWLPIDTAVQNLNYFSWSTPSFTVTSLALKIVARNIPGEPSDSLQAVTISSSTALTLLTFNNGSYIGGTPHHITWVCPGYSGNLSIEYSGNNGNTWSMVANGVNANNGSFLWNIPNGATTLGKIRLTGTSGITQQSSGTFSISVPPTSISLLYPAGGDTLSPGSMVEILWQAPAISSVKIYYSANNGVTWNTIGVAPAAGSFFWTVASATTQFGMIRIEDADNPSLVDYGSGPFVVQGLPIGSSSISLAGPLANSICKDTDFTLNVSGNGISSNAQIIVQISPAGIPFSALSTMIQTTASFFSAGTITCRLPQSIADGWYDVRVLASLPAIYSVVYDSLIRAKGRSFTLGASDDQLILPNENSVQISVSPVIAGATYALSVPGYATQQPQPTLTIQPLQPGFIAAEATVTDTTGCVSQLFNPYLVEVNRLFTVLTCNTPADSSFVRDLAFLTSGYGIAVMNTGNILVSSDTGKTWTLSYNGLNESYSGFSFANNGNTWIVSSNNGSLLSSTNYGQTWVRQQLSTAEEIRDLVFPSSGSGYLAGTNGMMKRFFNGGWNTFQSGTWNDLNALAVNSQGIYAVGEEGVIRRYNALQVDTLDAIPGVNWKRIHFASDSLGFIAGSQGHILKTTDGGLSWSLVHAGLNYMLEGLGRTGDTIFAVGSTGKVVFSPDLGNTWIAASVSYPNRLTAAASNPISKEGFIGGSQASIFRFRNILGGPDTLDVGNGLTEQNLLGLSLFPNPANDVIQLNWDGGEIHSVVFYDVAGKEVLHFRLTMPQEKFVVNVLNLPRGVYLVQCTNPSVSITKRLVLID